MAVLVAIAPGGSIQSSSNWAVTDTTSLQNGASNNSSTASTTFINSSSFTPGAITIDGIGLKFNGPTDAIGNFTVQLAIGGVSVSGTVVSIAKTDLTTLATGRTGYSWIFFKFSAPVTLTAATAYTIQCKVTSGASITILSTTTASNFIRFLRTTTTQAPTSSDSLVLANERTGSGTLNTVSITMDNVGITTFCGEINISDGATLAWGTSASTQYVLQLAGNLNVWLNGILTIASSGTPLPATSSANIIFVCASSNQFGMNCYDGSTVSMYGATKTQSTFTTAAVASAQAIVACADVTNWNVGDFIVLASTDTTNTHSDLRQIGTIIGLNVTANTNFTNAHRFAVGPPNYFCEVINITRNVVVKPSNTSFGTYWINKQSTTLTLSNVELAYFGSTSMNLDTTSTAGNTSIQNCSFHDWAGALNIGNTSYTNNANVTFKYNVLYNFTGNTINVLHTTTLTSVDLEHNVLILGGGYGMNITGVGATVYSNYVSGQTSGAFGIANTGTIGSFDSNFAHSCAGPAFVAYNNFILPNGIVSNLVAWCCTHGIRINNTSTNIGFILTFDGGNLYSFTTGAIAVDVAIDGNLLIRGMNVDGGTTPTSPYGYAYTANTYGVSMQSMTFSQYTSHSVGDIKISNASTSSLSGFNINLDGSTPISGLSNLTNPAVIYINRLNGNYYKTWTAFGTIGTDLSIYHTANQSMRITPSSSTLKIPGGLFRIAVSAGQTPTVSIYIRRSVIGDGAAYNGNAPRLILAKNIPLGLTDNTILATSVASAGTWELLTATLPSPTDTGIWTISVDCDGTAGWVNVDDFSSSDTPADTTGFSIWADGQPFVMYGASPPEVIIVRKRTKVR